MDAFGRIVVKYKFKCTCPPISAVMILFLNVVPTFSHDLGTQIPSNPTFAGYSLNAHQSGADVILSTAVVSLGNANYTDIVFPNAQLPTQTCGDRFSRCDVTMIHDQSGSRIVALLAVREGAAAALFDMVDSELRLIEQQIIPLPNNPDCLLTTFGAGAGDNVWYGLCYKLSNGEATVNVYRFFADFNSLSSFSLSLHIKDDDGESFLLSRAIFSTCSASDSVYWFSDGYVISLRTDLTSSVVEFSYNTLVSDCFGSGARQVLYRNGNLLAYCQTKTVEVDVCNQFGTTANFSSRFYCSGNESVYLEVGSENLQVNTRANFTIPFPLDTSIPYVGDCLYSNGQVFFVGTSADSTVVFTNVLQNSTTVLATDAPVIHRVVDNRFVTVSGLSFSSILDITCFNPASPILVTNRAFDLSTFVPNSEFSCLSVRSLPTTEPPTDSTTTIHQPTDSNTTRNESQSTSRPPVTVSPDTSPITPSTTPPTTAPTSSPTPNTFADTVTTVNIQRLPGGALASIILSSIVLGGIALIAGGIVCVVVCIKRNRRMKGQYTPSVGHLPNVENHPAIKHQGTEIKPINQSASTASTPKSDQKIAETLFTPPTEGDGTPASSKDSASSSPDTSDTILDPSSSQESSTDTEQQQQISSSNTNISITDMPKLSPAEPELTAAGVEGVMPCGVQPTNSGACKHNGKPISQHTPPHSPLAVSFPSQSRPSYKRVDESPDNQRVSNSSEHLVESSQPQENDSNSVAIVTPTCPRLPTTAQPDSHRTQSQQASTDQSRQASINQSHQASFQHASMNQSQQTSTDQSRQASINQSQRASVSHFEPDHSQSHSHLSSLPGEVTALALSATQDHSIDRLETTQSCVTGVQNPVPGGGFHSNEHKDVIAGRNPERDLHIAGKTEGASAQNESNIPHDYQQEDSTTSLRSTEPDNERSGSQISNSLINSQRVPESVYQLHSTSGRQ